MGAPDPNPPRKKWCPEGFPSLKGVRKIKVQKANILANFVANLVRKCIELRIVFSVEHLTNYLIWSMPEFVSLLERGDVEKVTFHACMFGSRRNKSTSLVATKGVFTSMNVCCDKSHDHLPWGVNRHVGQWKFATKDECEYLSKMCQAIATLAATACEVRMPGSLEYLTPKQKPSEASRTQRTKVGVQSSKGKQRNTVPEYAQILPYVKVMDPKTCDRILNMGPGRLEPPMQTWPRMCPVDTKVSNIQTLR